MKISSGNTWNTIYKMTTSLGLWSVMHHESSFRMLLLTGTKWASSIIHPSKERAETLPQLLDHGPVTLICILMTPSWNRGYGPISILAAFVDIRLVVLLDTTAAVILPLMANGIVTGGGPLSK